MYEQRRGHRDVVLKSQNELVYLEYTSGQLPPKPSAGPDGRQWTRFVCISDTHSRAIAVPDGDVLLHSGDLTNTGTVSDFEKTMEWLYGLSHPVKMYVWFLSFFPYGIPCSEDSEVELLQGTTI